MIVRVVYKPNKTVAVIHPAPKSKRPNETEEQWLERVFTKAMKGELKGCAYDGIDSAELPQSREDRDAWTGEKGKGVSIDQVKATRLRLEKSNREKVDKGLREMAIQSLKDKGELPEDYSEAEA